MYLSIKNSLRGHCQRERRAARANGGGMSMGLDNLNWWEKGVLRRQSAKRAMLP